MKKSKIQVTAEGIVSSKNGAKSISNSYGTIHFGWFMQVRDDEGKFETSFPVKTNDEALALQLSGAVESGKAVTVSGHLRNENYGGRNGKPDNWVQNLYVTDVVASA
jgi:hypothetical protein